MSSSSLTSATANRLRAVRYGAVLLLMLAACGKPASSPPASQPVDGAADQKPPQGGSPDAGTSTDVAVNPPSGNDGGAVGGDASRNDGGAPMNGDAAPTWKGIGVVRWTEWGAPAPRFNVGFGFATGSRRATTRSDRCAGLSKVGNCCLKRSMSCTATRDGTVDCPMGGGGMSSNPPPPPLPPLPPPDPADACANFTGAVDVGTINVQTNGKDVGRGVFDPLRGYGFIPSVTPFAWKGGDQLGVKVPGSACIPRFEGTIPAGAPFDVNPPSTINVADGFSVRWTPDPNGGTVWLSLSSTTTDGAEAMILCEVDDEAGMLTVDASLTRAFRPSTIVAGLTTTRFSEREVAPDMMLMSQYDHIGVATLR